ncbi:hypothetical protein GCM10023093_05990 [Nemorincola caseinilytica]|uniref:Uncharacterized protein n=1 Tax=Nemorincola caseinilytica TaxID=2054315 RepID=A0ABP8N4W6_9BACT
MKKVIPAISITVFAMMFFSCKKVYTCTCTNGATVISTRTLDKQKKKDAEAECGALSGPTVKGTTTVDLKCTLGR